jgi:peptidoglycan hydrolase CwlO-like protein
MQKTTYQGIYKAREGVLLNMDNEALEQYKKRKERQRKVYSLEKDVQSLKDDITQIKELLIKVLGNGNS